MKPKLTFKEMLGIKSKKTKEEGLKVLKMMEKRGKMMEELTNSNNFGLGLYQEQDMKKPKIPSGLITPKRTPLNHFAYTKLLQSRVLELPTTATVTYLTHPHGYDIGVVGTHPFSKQTNKICDLLIDKWKPDAFAIATCKCDYNFYCAALTNNYECPEIDFTSPEKGIYGKVVKGKWIRDYYGQLLCHDYYNIISKIAKTSDPRLYLIDKCVTTSGETESYMENKKGYFHKSILNSTLFDEIKIEDENDSLLIYEPIDSLSRENYDNLLNTYLEHMNGKYRGDFVHRVLNYHDNINTLLQMLKLDLEAFDESYIPLLMIFVRMGAYLPLVDLLKRYEFTEKRLPPCTDEENHLLELSN